MKKKLRILIALTFSFLVSIPTVFAEGEDKEVFKGFIKLKDLLIYGVSLAGVIWLIFTIINLAIANSNSDQSAKGQALLQIGSALMLIGVGIIAKIIAG